MRLGCIYSYTAWSLSLTLCTYSKWHQFSRSNHFWLSQTNFSCQSWSAWTTFWPGPNFCYRTSPLWSQGAYWYNLQWISTLQPKGLVHETSQVVQLFVSGYSEVIVSMHLQQPFINDGDNLYNVVGGDGQPSGGSEATGSRAQIVHDDQAGSYA